MGTEAKDKISIRRIMLNCDSFKATFVESEMKTTVLLKKKKRKNRITIPFVVKIESPVFVC